MDGWQYYVENKSVRKIYFSQEPCTLAGSEESVVEHCVCLLSKYIQLEAVWTRKVIKLDAAPVNTEYVVKLRKKFLLFLFTKTSIFYH